jgi:hypothetical protein
MPVLKAGWNISKKTIPSEYTVVRRMSAKGSRRKRARSLLSILFEYLTERSILPLDKVSGAM